MRLYPATAAAAAQASALMETMGAATPEKVLDAASIGHAGTVHDASLRFTGAATDVHREQEPISNDVGLKFMSGSGVSGALL